MPARRELLLPKEPYLPGQGASSQVPDLEAFKEGVSPGRSPAELAESAAFLGGLDAFSQGYYWEAHELLEAVWTCLPPASAERHLLRGLIQLANEGLKARMGARSALPRIRALAEEALSEAFLHGRKSVMGMTQADLQKLLARIDREGES